MKLNKLERIILLVLGVVIALRFAGAFLEHQRRQNAESLAPVAAPKFAWDEMDGKTHYLTDHKGKVVVLHFWASWCGPCREEFPRLLKAAELLKDDDIIFITVAGDDEKAPVQKFLDKAKKAAGVEPANVYYAFDPLKLIIYDSFQTSVFPESVALDTKHIMRRKYSGPVEWDQPDMLAYLRALKKPQSDDPDLGKNRVEPASAPAGGGKEPEDSEPPVKDAAP